jgi:copper chaperone CopZ
MCVNCVANVDAAVAAVGGVTGVWISLKSHLRLVLTPSRIRAATITATLALTLAPFAIAFTGV